MDPVQTFKEGMIEGLVGGLEHALRIMRLFPGDLPGAIKAIETSRDAYVRELSALKLEGKKKENAHA